MKPSTPPPGSLAALGTDHETQELRLALKFAQGQGRLVASPFAVGGAQVLRLELSLPGLTFPCDIKGGVLAFRSHASRLDALTVHLGKHAIDTVLRHTSHQKELLASLCVHLHDGFFIVQGSVQHAALADAVPFTVRVYIVASDAVLAAQDEGARGAHIVFDDLRLYGPLPICATTLAERLRQALVGLIQKPMIEPEGASVWRVDAERIAAHTLLQHHGFSVPACSDGHTAVVVTTQAVQLLVDSQPFRAKESEGTKALADSALAAHRFFAPAEQVLRREGFAAASKRFFEAAFGKAQAALSSATMLRWARMRCYTLALFNEKLFPQQLPWQDIAGDAPMQLLLAARLSAQQQYLQAAELYEAVALCEPLAVDQALALLAAARERRALGEAKHEQAAISYLRRACALAPLPPYAKGWLCLLLNKQKDTEAALEASRAWLDALEQQDALDLKALAEASCTAAQLCLASGHGTEEAQEHLERLLQRLPDHEPALWQLLGVQGAACLVQGAQQTIGRLRHRALAMESGPCADSLVKLGDAAHDALGDPEVATALYMQALKRLPNHAKAHLRMGQRAQRLEDEEGVLHHMQAIFAAAHEQEANGHGALTDNDLSLAHLLLGGHYMAQNPANNAPNDITLGLKHLRLALSLNGERGDVRRQLEDALRAAKDWSALADLLVSSAQWAQAKGRLQEARRWQLQAARLHLCERNEPHKALEPLLGLVRQSPHDDEALQLLVPLLQQKNDQLTLRHVLTNAAAPSASVSALRRGYWLHALWHLEMLQGAEASVQLPIVRELLTLFPQNEAAAQAQVQLLEHDSSVPKEAVTAHDEALADAYVILAQVLVHGPSRAQALRKAARTYAYAGHPLKALDALQQSRENDALDVDSWLLGAQLKHDLEGVRQARAWLGGAVAAAELDAPKQQPFAHRLYDRLAELAAFDKDTSGEIDALLGAIRLGGTSYGVCVRLLGALKKAQRHKEQADWLMHWAQAGWPLQIAPSYAQAASLYRMLGMADEARVALRALAQIDTAAMEQAGLELAALGRLQQHLDDEAEGLMLQHRAAIKRHDTAAMQELSAARIVTYEKAQNTEQAVALCRELLAQDPRARLPHSTLCRVMAKERQWANALDHGLQATLFGQGAPLEDARDRDTWDTTFALAMDLRPELQPELQRLCPYKGFGICYSDRLVGQSDWLTAEHFLQHLLQHATDDARAKHARLRLAALYAGPLHRVDEALRLLRENLAKNNHDIDSRRALLPVYQTLGDTAQRAELHLALSNLVGSVDESLQHTLASAELYAQDPNQRTTAVQIIMAFARRMDVPRVCPELWAGMRRMGMLQELRQVLAQGLQQEPSADDSRLAVLVRLCAQELDAMDFAQSLCERMQQTFPQSDTPWHLHIELLMKEGGKTSKEQLERVQSLYQSWAELRDGEAKANILDALAQHLRGAGEATLALRALEAALDVSDAGPERAQERLVVLCDRYLARADFFRAEQTLLRLCAAMPPSSQQDHHLRRLASLCEDHLQAPDRALKALVRLQHKLPTDFKDMARLSALLDEAQVFGDVPDLIHHVDAPLLWRMGKKLVVARKLKEARLLLHAVLQRAVAQNHLQDAVPENMPSAEDVWTLADDVWPEQGALRTLCAWRLHWAETAPLDWPLRLRLLALTALHADGTAREDAYLHKEDEERLAVALQRSFADSVLQQVGETEGNRQNHLLQGFALARLLHMPERTQQLAALLLCELPADDMRRVDALVVACEAALSQGEPASALALVKELTALRDAGADALMMRVLRAQQDRGPYLQRLMAKVQVTLGDPLPNDLLTLAEEQLHQGLLEGAQQTLARVPLLSRDFAWGGLACQVNHALGEHEREADAAALAAHLAPNPQQRARFLRAEAAVRWWDLGAVEAAHALLIEAQALEPLRYQDLDRALCDDDVQASKRRLHEALVVMPPQLAATLWRRLAALLPENDQREEAMNCALRLAGDDAHELGLLAEAARAAGARGVLHGALLQLADLARPHEPRRAARLWLEAAHGLDDLGAAALWVRAAAALFAVGVDDEARTLIQRALAAGYEDLSLDALVWRHLPHTHPCRRKAARGLARYYLCDPKDAVKNSDAEAVKLHQPIALFIAAAQQALQINAAKEACGYAAWALTHNVDEAGAAIDKTLAHEALRVYEQALEDTQDVTALLHLWRRGCAMLMPEHPWARSRRRRAALLTVALVPEELARLALADLLTHEPNDFEAQVQSFGLLARDEPVANVLQKMDEVLAVLQVGAHRTALCLSAAHVLARHFPKTDAAITVLGSQLRVAMAAWQHEREHADVSRSDEDAVSWQQVAVLGDALAHRLGQAGSEGDKLTVLAHCARVAPASVAQPRLAQAGFLAQASGQQDLAYTLLYPVAVAASHEGVDNESVLTAQEFCCKVAQERRDAVAVVDLMTRMAQRSAPGRAAQLFVEAATWADEGQLGEDQSLRLLQASYALRPEPEIAMRLIDGLIRRGDVAALIAAHHIFVEAQLDDAVTEKLGLRLIDQLGEVKHRDADRHAAIHALWRRIDERLPQLPQARGYRLEEARRGNDLTKLLMALEDNVAEAAPDGISEMTTETRSALHGEAAQVALQLNLVDVAWRHWQAALMLPEPSIGMLFMAWQTMVADDPAKAASAPWARAWLLGRIAELRPMLIEQARHCATPTAQRVLSLRLLLYLAQNENDEPFIAETSLALYALIKDSGTTPDRTLCNSVSAQAIAALTACGDYAGLAQHLQQEAQRASTKQLKQETLWRLGDVLRLHLDQPMAALAAYQAALGQLPQSQPMALRLGAAKMALKCGQAAQAIGYAALGPHENVTAADGEQLELLLEAMVAADELEDCEKIATELTLRQPHNLFALHARAILLGRAALQKSEAGRNTQALAAAEKGFCDYAAALSRKDAKIADRLSKRGEALMEAARFATLQGDTDALERACQALRAAIGCDADNNVRLTRMEKLTSALTAVGQWREAALMCEARAEASVNDPQRVNCWMQAAELWLKHPEDAQASLDALWQAADLAADRADIWLALLDRLPADADEQKWLLVADKLLFLRPPELQDKDRLSLMARAYVRHDAHKALALFAQAEALGGVSFHLRGQWQEVAWQCDDMDTFVPLARAVEAADGALPAADDDALPQARMLQLQRRIRLAEAALFRNRGSRKEGLRYLRAAISLLPHPSTEQDVPIMRLVAQVCATEPEYADIALKLYAIVLTHRPMDVEALRIAARLAGQLNLIDRAYGLYACLLWLFPSDDEAKAFVDACRAQGQVSAAVAKSGPWVKRVQRAIDELIAQGAEDSTLNDVKPFAVAQLLRCDIEVVLKDMLDDVVSTQSRGRALSGSQEALTLFKLAQSSHYVQLRHKLGASLAQASD